jgi:hypothetical protein
MRPRSRHSPALGCGGGRHNIPISLREKLILHFRRRERHTSKDLPGAFCPRHPPNSCKRCKSLTAFRPYHPPQPTRAASYTHLPPAFLQKVLRHTWSLRHARPMALPLESGCGTRRSAPSSKSRPRNPRHESPSPSSVSSTHRPCSARKSNSPSGPRGHTSGT